MAEQKKYGKVSCSLFGKTAAIIPRETCVEIRTTGTWLIIAALWVCAGAFFWLSLIFNSLIISCIFTVIGGVGGFLLASKLYTGKLTDSFNYNDINCFIYTVPELTIAKKDNFLYALRMLPKQELKLIELLSLQLNTHETLSFVERNGKYYIDQK